MRFDFGENVFDKQSDQKSRIDIGSKEQEFTIEEQRLAQNFGGEPKRLQYHRYRENQPCHLSINFSSEISSGKATLIEFIRHK